MYIDYQKVSENNQMILCYHGNADSSNNDESCWELNKDLPRVLALGSARRKGFIADVNIPLERSPSLGNVFIIGMCDFDLKHGQNVCKSTFFHPKKSLAGLIIKALICCP